MCLFLVVIRGCLLICFFFSSRRRHTRLVGDWSSDVCSSDLTPEQLQGQAPGELGRVLGLDRVPEVKTLRRKLGELADRRQAHVFHQGLAAHWLQQDPDVVGFLYVDGHVRPYHGHAHRLPEAHVARRRLCLPATTDFYVNAQDAAPLFRLTAPANDGLIRMLRTQILPELRRQLGPDRRVTVVFDREGWSPTLFAELLAAGFDFLTYRKGKTRPWPGNAFAEVTGLVAGQKVTYTLAEKGVRLTNGLKVREVRRLTATGHQTAVLTNRTDLPALDLAARMFARWQQENFFRYLRHSFALDALVTYAAEPADPSRTVPNPARKRLKRQLAAVRRTLAAREQAYGAEALTNPEGRRPTMRGFKIAHGKLAQAIRTLQATAQRLARRLKALPARVPIGELQPRETVVQLAPEAKLLTDSIKLTAYRAETSLVGLLGPHYARTEEEGRALLRELFTAPADLLLDDATGVLRVRLHSLANPRSNRAVAALCEALTATETCFQNSTNFPTTPLLRSIWVTVRTRSVAVAPSASLPVSLNPTTWGMSINTGWPSIAASASIPPTPHPRTPRPLIMVVWESVPTRVSGYACGVASWPPSVVASVVNTTRAKYSRLT